MVHSLVPYLPGLKGLMERRGAEVRVTEAYGGPQRLRKLRWRSMEVQKAPTEVDA